MARHLPPVYMTPAARGEAFAAACAYDSIEVGGPADTDEVTLVVDEAAVVQMAVSSRDCAETPLPVGAVRTPALPLGEEARAFGDRVRFVLMQHGASAEGADAIVRAARDLMPRGRR